MSSQVNPAQQQLQPRCEGTTQGNSRCLRAASMQSVDGKLYCEQHMPRICCECTKPAIGHTLDEAVLQATKPFPNGCSFRVVIGPRESVSVEYGCYRGPWAVSGEAQEWFHNQLKAKPTESIPVKIHPATRNALLAPSRQCPHCHAPWFTK